MITYILIFFLCPKVPLNDIKSLLIYFHVFVALQELYLVQAKNLLYNDSIRVGSSTGLHLLFTKPQDILKTIQGHLPTLC